MKIDWQKYIKQYQEDLLAAASATQEAINRGLDMSSDLERIKAAMNDATLNNCFSWNPLRLDILQQVSFPMICTHQSLEQARFLAVLIASDRTHKKVSVQSRDTIWWNHFFPNTEMTMQPPPHTTIIEVPTKQLELPSQRTDRVIFVMSSDHPLLEDYGKLAKTLIVGQLSTVPKYFEMIEPRIAALNHKTMYQNNQFPDLEEILLIELEPTLEITSLHGTNLLEQAGTARNKWLELKNHPHFLN